ncbi:MAG TPA: hypothetical protein VHR84_16805 [Terriglobales bacterium]|jgi:hypothetical protein|nr:hypothetical protein [Terriglobales bacterium]
MKALTLALLLSLPVPRLAPPATTPVHTAPQARKGGRWYFAANGHAVYCYGPVRYLPEAEGGLKRVATFCRGDQPIVQLKD